MPRALLSVSNKTGLVELGRGLAARGYELVSTGGTARALADAGLPVTSVASVTGFPEMMDGRVKTLHPKIHAGILARRAHADDRRALAEHAIEPIDLVVVNLYPFEETARKPGVTFDELVEQIDIGGPSMVRAAAKNFHDVLVVVDPGRYDAVLRELDRPGGPTAAFRFALAQAAFAHTAAYDDGIRTALAGFRAENGRVVRGPDAGAAARGDTLAFTLRKLRDLRYGENPHQKAALYQSQVAGATPWDVLQGKELSYTNLLDLDAAVRIMLEFAEPAAVVIKHTNPCGAAIGDAAADAYVRARDADPLSAFGGIVGLNRPLDRRAAEAIISSFIEAVVAPAVTDDARDVLARKANLRVVIADFASLAPAPSSAPAEELRSTLAGVLVQDRDRVPEARDPWPEGDFPKVVTKRAPSADEWAALRFAWRICAHVKSNTVVFTDAQKTLAVGAGQMSRVDAVNVAVLKAAAAERSLRGSVAASDAFFPFRDGLDAAAAAGATAIVQPGGSVRDADVIAAADQHGLAMIFTGRRHFRH
jgi:phosphoribosylaminoimidazolecarboxamide formyltransferase / IMP cyclohydrolase